MSIFRQIGQVVFEKNGNGKLTNIQTDKEKYNIDTVFL